MMKIVLKECAVPRVFGAASAPEDKTENPHKLGAYASNAAMGLSASAFSSERSSQDIIEVWMTSRRTGSSLVSPGTDRV